MGPRFATGSAELVWVRMVQRLTAQKRLRRLRSAGGVSPFEATVEWLQVLVGVGQLVGVSIDYFEEVRLHTFEICNGQVVLVVFAEPQSSPKLFGRDPEEIGGTRWEAFFFLSKLAQIPERGKL